MRYSQDMEIFKHKYKAKKRVEKQKGINDTCLFDYPSELRLDSLLEGSPPVILPPELGVEH